MIPLAVVPLALALGGPRPLFTAANFIAGMFVAYWLAGLILVAGLEVVFDYFGGYFARLWNQPNAIELAMQVLIGLLLIASSVYLLKNKKSVGKAQQILPAGPRTLFILGATLIVVGMPGAVPYAVAAERIVQQDVGWLWVGLCLLWYNFVFVTPFLIMLLLPFLLPSQSEACFAALTRFAAAALPLITALLCFVLGVVMAVDGIGWLLGYPLLPVSADQTFISGLPTALVRSPGW